MLTDADDEETREEIIGRLESAQTSVVINCFLLAYGVDVPAVECVILARPTRSLTMFLQMCGRGLRAAPDKAHCILIDHGHVVENLGLPQTEYEWTLDEGRNVNVEAHETKAGTAAAETVRTCGDCAALWLTSEQGNCCPECGWIPPQRARPIAVQDADLEEMTDDAEVISPNDPRVFAFFRQACGWKADRKPQVWAESPNKIRWAAWAETRVRFGIADTVGMPRGSWDVEPLAPSREVGGWLQHRLIKYARARSRARE
jgi:hypothetical protein